MTPRTLFRGCLLLAVTALTALLLPGTAGAIVLPDHKVVAGEQVSMAGGTATTVAVCPQGMQVVGGGGRNTGGGSVALIQSAPEIGAQQLWRVRVHNPTTDEVRFQAFAVCARGFTDHRLIAQPFTLPANDPGYLPSSAKCPTPDTLSLLGGGWSVPPGVTVSNHESVSTLPPPPPFNHWYVTAKNPLPTPAAGTNNIVCAYGYPPFVHNGTVVTVPPFGTATTLAGCPDGAVIGGGGGSRDPNAVITDSYPDSDRMWVVRVKNTTHESIRIASVIYCVE